ncbi:uncharacterized LOC128125822 homolog isoform X2 [Hyla sarda]|uniref:uncharacterized LOC128125822 homolog isoform X2 n=1 Tax=Hyla sarda TaxID=327740 RepID=UPI0024C349A6|nr:uncharacterized LOC128125822 homolog isoform X2 [Hyla sarda]
MLFTGHGGEVCARRSGPHPARHRSPPHRAKATASSRLLYAPSPPAPRPHHRFFLGTVCMIKIQSSMSKHSPFCGVLGHTFMEFLKGSGDYCQAQHDLYADK